MEQAMVYVTKCEYNIDTGRLEIVIFRTINIGLMFMKLRMNVQITYMSVLRFINLFIISRLNMLICCSPVT